mmetsp:Transcript_14417/g.27109  ORF Transcript_14417/g.27109 Transcript_14417/m.27109 type:complete len:108 (+) Transcript_14417:364-687(+)
MKRNNIAKIAKTPGFSPDSSVRRGLNTAVLFALVLSLALLITLMLRNASTAAPAGMISAGAGDINGPSGTPGAKKNLPTIDSMSPRVKKTRFFYTSVALISYVAGLT